MKPGATIRPVASMTSSADGGIDQADARDQAVLDRDVGPIAGDGATWTLIAALMGGTLAATSHVAKATTRAAVNTSPEPFSNLGLSLLGDAAVPAMLWLAWEQPVWFFAALGVVVVAGLVATFVLFRFLRALVRRVGEGVSRDAVGA
jgi:hypothetical protein